MKKLLVVLIVAGLAGGGYYVVKSKNTGPEAIAVETAAVELQTIVQTVTATGRIQPKTQVNISADVSAKITRLDVKEGDWVEKGTLLLELDSERYAAAVEVAEASLRSVQSEAELARENMIKAQKDFERSKGLFDRDLESQATLDGAYAGAQAEKARYQASLDLIERSRASLKQIRDDLDKTRIYAPLSGTVSQLNKEEGEIALGSQFQEDIIMVVSNLGGMEAVVDVDENDIVQVAVADTASIEVDALPGISLSGKVTEIANSAKLTGDGSADQKTEFQVKVAVTVENESLRPGMTASSEIVTETKHDVIGVPIQAVAVRTLDQLEGGLAEGAELGELEADKDGFVEFVFVVRDGTSQVRQVETGIQSDSHIEILAGLEEGDEIVIGNYRAISKELEHGSAIESKSEPKAGTIIAQN